MTTVACVFPKLLLIQCFFYSVDSLKNDSGCHYIGCVVSHKIMCDILQYGDGVGNSIEENSCVFSLI